MFDSTAKLLITTFAYQSASYLVFDLEIESNCISWFLKTLSKFVPKQESTRQNVPDLPIPAEQCTGRKNIHYCICNMHHQKYGV